MQDMRQEAEKYGKVISLTIPRPKKFNELPPGSGNVYIEYSNVNEARIARRVNSLATHAEAFQAQDRRGELPRSQAV
jgi:hypothetical protein